MKYKPKKTIEKSALTKPTDRQAKKAAHYTGIAFARKESPSVVFQKCLAIVETSAANEWSSASFKPSSFISSVLKGSVCSSQNEEQRYPEVRN